MTTGGLGCVVRDAPAALPRMTIVLSAPRATPVIPRMLRGSRLEGR